MHDPANQIGFHSRIGTLLACGVLSGPLFYVVVVIQMLTRSGFDIRYQPISLLSLGTAGWIQIMNFLLTGTLAVACAIGMREALRGAPGAMWAPLLIATYGLGTIVAGLFRPDAALGFPPGTPPGMPATMSTHAALHGVGFFVAFLSLTLACFVLARRFLALRRLNWALYSLATGLLTPVLIAVAMSQPSAMSLLFAIDGIIAFGWLAAIAMRLIRDRTNGSAQPAAEY